MPEAPAWEQLRTRFAGCFSRLILSEWTLTAQVASLLEASLVAPAGLKSTNVVYVLGAAASVLMVAIGPNVLLFVKKGGGQQVREVRPQHLGKERALHTGPNGEALILGIVLRADMSPPWQFASSRPRDRGGTP